jgi:hypothetical protein
MKANEFASKICEAIDLLPGSDGEPGYYATTDIILVSDEMATINITTLSDDIKVVEENYLVIVIKKPR